MGQKKIKGEQFKVVGKLERVDEMKIKAFAFSRSESLEAKAFLSRQKAKVFYCFKMVNCKSDETTSENSPLGWETFFFMRFIHLPEWMAKIIIFFHYFYSSSLFVLIPPNELSS